MSDFRLVHVDTSGGLTPPANVVAVAIGDSGGFDWTDAQVMGHNCATAEEWDHMVNRLIKSLEEVRRKGHAKLKENQRVKKANSATVT